MMNIETNTGTEDDSKRIENDTRKCEHVTVITT